MYQMIHRSTIDSTDTAGFLETLNKLGDHRQPEAQGLFDREAEVVVCRAPGRLDVMGGIADYSGSLVLQLPIREATFAAVQRTGSPELRIVSLSESQERESSFEICLDEFYAGGHPISYETARALFQRDARRHWASYVAGVFLVLMRERGINFEQGARILISSAVPEGLGVSSSAALEVSVMQAVGAAYDIKLAPSELPLLCQMVENLVAGAPCGVMDQMTAACGEENRLLALRCQPAELVDQLQIPGQITFCGLDSGIRHSVGGADYGQVRAGAFMGYRIIAELAGLEKRNDEVTVHIEDPRWHGYLANLSPAEFERDYSRHVPEQMNGAEFSSRFHGTTDPISHIRPDRDYAVRVPTMHPIYENDRVRQFAELMSGSVSEGDLELMGELMYQSHASYSACGLWSAGTDLLVRLVREAGTAHGLYGARITAGGSGGTVAVLCRAGAEEGVAKIASRYREETGHQPYIFQGSSPGSAAFGYLRLKQTDPVA